MYDLDSAQMVYRFFRELPSLPTYANRRRHHLTDCLAAFKTILQHLSILLPPFSDRSYHLAAFHFGQLLLGSPKPT